MSEKLPENRPTVADALTALGAFAIDLDRPAATRLLALWRFNGQLTELDRLAILDKYSAGPTAGWNAGSYHGDSR